MKKTGSIIITSILIIFIGFILMGSSSENSSSGGSGRLNNVEIKNGIQYITVDAKGGYTPELSLAKSGVPTKLIIKTSGTYDCSAFLVIPSLNLQKILPKTGDTEIDLGIPKTGEPLDGVCSMGMYNFKVKFN